ncbi:uncharacterized protein LOC115483536 [Drosophila hydei]|uniref:Uncharacterized protein LOC111595694 n=1 Tax=Drosophila hydei TaxID=7224 RepID=A0A6J2SUT5_DROHY|nr:uncharacterized protein LOC111595694 [Drosophila hydei]XP_030081573.1 uncharacterized protein LOC115483536 [Drosophila hydei]
MWLHIEFLFVSFLVIIFAICSSALNYIFVAENEDFFEDCVNSKSNVLNFDGIVNKSELSFTLHDEVILVSGNVTFIWDIQPGDRVQATFKTNKYDRGSWQLTPYVMKMQDFRPTLFDKDQHFYKFWTRHIINVEEIKETIFYPGTKIIHEPFDINVTMEFTGVPVSGRYKITTLLKAYDSNNLPRDTSICFEVIGEVDRL